MSSLSTVGRFYVFIGNKAQALFTELSGLQVETEIFEYSEGGNNGFVHQLPGRTRVSRLTLKQGMVASDELFRWYLDLAYGKKVDRRNISVVMFDEAGAELRRWNFLNAYPVRWVGPSLEAGSGSTAVETLELAHDGLQLG